MAQILTFGESVFDEKGMKCHLGMWERHRGGAVCSERVALPPPALGQPCPAWPPWRDLEPLTHTLRFPPCRAGLLGLAIHIQHLP